MPVEIDRQGEKIKITSGHKKETEKKIENSENQRKTKRARKGRRGENARENHPGNIREGIDTGQKTTTRGEKGT